MTVAVVTSIGAHTALGPGIVPTCAALRAGLSRKRLNEDYVPLAPALATEPPGPIRFAPAPGLEGVHAQDERLARLAVRAVAECATTSGLGRAGLEGLRCFLALAETGREGLEPIDPARVWRALRKATGLALGDPVVRCGGHAAGLELTAEAAALVRDEPGQGALVVAVDSSVLQPHLAWLDRQYRLASERNPDGFVPGEAALAILVEAPGGIGGRVAPPLVLLDGSGSADEPQPLSGDAQSTATGLTSAIRAATRGAEPPSWTLSDQNGESYRSREWGLVLARLAAELPGPDHWHAAESLGDIGAASGLLQIAMAARAFARGYAPGPRALLTCASDSGRRAAALVSAPSS